MATLALTTPDRPTTDQTVIVKTVTVIIGAVVGLTFTLGFGNVLTLALRLGILVWVAPLVALQIDLHPGSAAGQAAPCPARRDHC